jgi:alkylation response protein AidB-like acyl-CoA dehydrogenase
MTISSILAARPAPLRLTDAPRFDALLRRIAEHAPETDAEGSFPEKAFAWLAEAGLLAVTLPGRELDFNQARTRPLLHLLKRIGAANLSVGRVYEGHLNALWLIHVYGTTEQQTRWYADAAAGRLFSVWNTQADDGVTLHPTGAGTLTLRGAKTFCSGAGWIDRPLVTGAWADDPARQGWQMAVIPTERVQEIPQDARFWRPLGMRASASFRMDFTGIELTEEDLLGPPDAYYRQPHFGGGAIRFAAVQLGGAEAVFDATRQFLTAQGRLDDPFQRARLAEMAVLIESGNHWLDAAGDKTDAWLNGGGAFEKIVSYANAVRTVIEEICLRMLPLAERCVGARGLLRPNAFERIHRDLTHYLRQPAPDATLTELGRYVLQSQTPAHDLWR